MRQFKPVIIRADDCARGRFIYWTGFSWSPSYMRALRYTAFVALPPVIAAPGLKGARIVRVDRKYYIYHLLPNGATRRTELAEMITVR
jgi:hypothetical protein